jgi:hypothetical protein
MLKVRIASPGRDEFQQRFIFAGGPQAVRLAAVLFEDRLAPAAGARPLSSSNWARWVSFETSFRQFAALARLTLLDLTDDERQAVELHQSSAVVVV